MERAELTPTLLASLNLGMQPFAPPKTCEALFHNTALDMLVNSIFQQLDNENSVQIIKGEYGSGKTCLAKRIDCEKPDKTHLSIINAHPELSFERLLNKLLPDTHHPQDTDFESLNTAVYQFLSQQLGNQRHTIILIDNAHELPANTLESLLSYVKTLNADNNGGLKLIILAERHIETTLNEINDSLLAPFNIHTSLLRPLNRNEVDSYIRYRLKHLNAKRDMPLDKKQLTHIQQSAGGLPYKIDELCCELLNNDLAAQQYSYKKPLFAVISILACVSLAYAFLFSNNQQGIDTTEIQQPSEQAGAATNTNISEAAEISLSQESTINSNKEALVSTNQNTLDTNPLAEDTPQEFAEGETTQDLTNISLASEPALEAEPPQTSTEPAKAPAQPLVSSSDWLSKQAPEHYVIQLMAASNYASLAKYQQQLQLNKPIVHHLSSRNGQNWHTLLYGPFTSQRQAEAAILELPAEIKANTPWIRSIRGLQKNL